MLPRSQMLETWRASETIVLSFRFRCGKLEVLRQIFIFDSALRKERLLAELSVILGSVTLSGIHRTAFGLVDAPGSANSFGIHRTNGLAPSLGLPHGIHHQKVWIGMSCGGHSLNRFIGLVDAPGSANSFGTHRTNGLAPSLGLPHGIHLQKVRYASWHSPSESLGMSHGHSPPESQVCLVAFTYKSLHFGCFGRRRFGQIPYWDTTSIDSTTNRKSCQRAQTERQQDNTPFNNRTIR
jgi:hypothetical protein